MDRSRSHDAVIRVYDEAGNVIDTHKRKGRFQRVVIAVRGWHRACAQCAARESEVHVTGTIRRPHQRLGIGIGILIITAFMLSALARQ